MAKLTDIELERVDGVDEPATRQKFLILKAEEPDELRENVKELLDRVEAALHALAKAEDLMLPEEAAQALNDVAKALDLGLSFKAKKPSKGEEEYGYPEPKKPAKKDGLDIDALAGAIASAIRQEFAPLMDLAKSVNTKSEAKSDAKPASRQPMGQDVINKAAPRKLGEGLFTDIVFGG